MGQGQGCMIDVLQTQSTAAGVFEHIWQQYGMSIVKQQHTIL
jgi:hypothetical protein